MYEHGFGEQHDTGINFCKIIFSKIVPIVLPTVSLAAEICCYLWCYWLNNDCAIDITWSSSNSLKAVDLSIGFS